MGSLRMYKDSPYKLKYLNEEGDDVHFSELAKQYFLIDAKHDKTLKSSVSDENDAISKAIESYRGRFDEIKFMEISNDNFKKIQDDGATIDAMNISVKVAGADKLFKDFIKDDLKIELPEMTETLKSCTPITSTGVTHPDFYRYLRFFNIYDMGHQFPDKIPSPSYIIDSASSVNKINAVPNICTKKNDNNKYDLTGYVLPGETEFNDVSNHSLLFYGDLQIAHFYAKDICLNVITLDMIISAETIAQFEGTFKNKLLQYSIIAINIFWQNVLSYVKVYTDLQDNNESKTSFGYALKILRHWVFTSVELNDSKTIYKGSFYKKIDNDQEKVTYISWWFLKNHHGITGDHEVNEMVDDTASKQLHEFNVTQSNCARTINWICQQCGQPSQAIGRSTGASNGIIEAMETYKYICLPGFLKLYNK